ncbi:MAG TPA: hypothetical protein VGP22_11410, partial [Albitalea sp.]|nr:hypothetical protein [Albitalea sp.]
MTGLMRVGLAALLALAAACGSALADGPACPNESTDLATGNAMALRLFGQRVVQPSQVGSPSRTRPSAYVRAESHGAVGDGLADDTRALQHALDRGQRVWLRSGGTYRITHRLELG